MSAATSDGSRGQILDRAAAEAVAASLRVLGDATRLQLLELLARSDHPMTVRELTKAIGLAQSTVSFHLARLADAQLVLVERTGRTSPYRLNPDALAGAMGSGHNGAPPAPPRRPTRMPQGSTEGSPRAV